MARALYAFSMALLGLLVAASASSAVELGVSPGGMRGDINARSGTWVDNGIPLSMSGETLNQTEISPVTVSPGICPEEKFENSPAFQRWVQFQELSQVPKGRPTVLGIPSSLRDWLTIFAQCPSVETLGYYPPSLRDAQQMVVALGPVPSAAAGDIFSVSDLDTGGKMPPSRAGETPAAANVVIGLLLPETEPLSLSVRQGALMAVEDSKGNGGVTAHLVIRGAVGQWGTDGVEAARMVTDDGAQGLIAPPDGAGSHLALQVAGRTATPVISLCADSSVTRTGVPWMVRVPPGTIEEATKIFCGLRPTAKHWVACVPEGRRGREIVHDLTEAARKSGVSVQRTIEVKWPMVDLPGFCDRVLSNNTDGILLWLAPIPAASIRKGLGAAGFKGRLAGPSWLRCPDFENATGPALEDFAVASPVRDEYATARFEKFASAFRTRFGRGPDATAAMSYDAAQLLIRILNRSGNRPPNEAFPLDFSSEGVTGNLSFDGQGNRQVDLELQEGRGAGFVWVGPTAAQR